MTSPAPQNGYERAFARLSAQAERVIDTPCAAVFLTGGEALKLKKPVDFGFLDYSTLERRRWAAGRELEFNRATAPDVYLGVIEVEGEPVVRMRRFDEAAVLANRPEACDGALAEALGRAVARFHRQAPVTEEGGAGAIEYVLGSNAGLLREGGDVLGSEAVEALVVDSRAAFERVALLLERRRAAGLSRRCHGDLHLGNIFVEDGRPVLFDCIEFNDTLNRIDVLYDLAFLLMDLCFVGRLEAANRVMNAWADEAARSFGEAGFTGLMALPLLLSVRAGVRAHVSLKADDPAQARRYLQAARAFLEPAPPSVLAVGGLSGSGKTTFARARAPDLGPAPGAMLLRSDEIRKRMWGAGPLDRLPPEAYAPGESGRVYARMFEEAALCLTVGRAVVLDAVFLRPEERDAAETLARDHGVPFEGVWLDAPPQVMRARIDARTGDASDADGAVLEEQLTRDPGEIRWTRRPGP
ncbi:MAG TPA: AAA family ATPase [Caulobacteraceae bacterium]|nr:AAA family ATPase [Caulobacteraceae bacterium]